MREMQSDGVLRGVRVLIVEDESVVAMALQKQLEDFGCQVVGPAPRISKALALLELEKSDIAVLDLNLGGELSTPVAEALAARGVPFIVITGYEDAVLGDQVLRQAPRLSKPFRIGGLINALTGMLLSAGS